MVASSGTSTATDAAAAKTRFLPLWNVVLLDDDDHTYDYVIEMLTKVVRVSVETAFQMAREVDETGRVIVFTAPRETAEFRCEQIQGYGPDPRIPRCKGSMSAVVEPAP